MKNLSKKKRYSALGLENHLPTEGPGRDDMMQLYSWSFEDACEANEKWRGRFGPDIQGRGPLCRWIGAQELQGLYELYRTGKKSAIIEAIHICSLNSLPIPRWCELSFLVAYRKVRQYKAKSWDDVFERPHKKGVNLSSKKQEREKSYLVFKRIEQLKKNESIGPDLFERVGKELGIGGKTLTESYYYKIKKTMELE